MTTMRSIHPLHLVLLARKIPKYPNKGLIMQKGPGLSQGRPDLIESLTSQCLFSKNLRVVHTLAILFLKSMSERVGSDKQRL